MNKQYMFNKKTQQIDFSSVLFDTLFGLVLFFSIDSFLEIRDPLHFIFYLFSLVILVHWWLIFKSVDDAFQEEVSDSGLDIVIGIIELVLIEYVVLSSRAFDFVSAGWFLIALFLVDLIWTIVWRYVGKWKTKNKSIIKNMEHELYSNFKTLFVGLVLFIPLLVFSIYLFPALFIWSFISFYLIFIVMTFHFKIIDIDIF